MQHVTAYERLAAKAAVTGDRALVHKALLTHPLVAQDSVSAELVDRLLEADFSEDEVHTMTVVNTRRLAGA